MPIKTDGAITRLSTLNTIASYLGMPPLINLVDAQSDPDFQTIDNIIDEVSVTIQSEGLPCNMDHDLPLEPDPVTGEILIPAGALLTDPTQLIDNKYVEREGKLYDTKERTFNIGRTLKVDVIWTLEYDSLPQVVKRYVEVVAARTAIARLKGEADLAAGTQVDEARTLSEYQRYTQSVGDYNMLDNPDTAYIFHRDFDITRF